MAGETVHGRSSTRGLGGKGANQSVAAARAGAAVRFLGGFGDDVDGRELRRRLAAAGVDAGAAVEGAPTGSAYVLVTNDGENARSRLTQSALLPCSSGRTSRRGASARPPMPWVSAYPMSSRSPASTAPGRVNSAIRHSPRCHSPTRSWRKPRSPGCSASDQGR
nr:PfkB family carbohydrate kinase [Amycolatopsis endophytica]